MSGKQAKKLRKQQGISVQAKRAQQHFERAVARTIVRGDEQALGRRKQRRQARAWAALAVVVGLGAALLWTVLR